MKSPKGWYIYRKVCRFDNNPEGVTYTQLCHPFGVHTQGS